MIYKIVNEQTQSIGIGETPEAAAADCMQRLGADKVQTDAYLHVIKTSRFTSWRTGTIVPDKVAGRAAPVIGLNLTYEMCGIHAASRQQELVATLYRAQTAKPLESLPANGPTKISIPTELRKPTS